MEVVRCALLKHTIVALTSLGMLQPLDVLNASRPWTCITYSVIPMYITVHYILGDTLSEGVQYNSIMLDNP